MSAATIQERGPSIPAVGVWADKENKYIYQFLKDNTAKFWGVKHTWSFQRQAYDETPGSVDGVWRYAEGSCWLGENKERMGNTMIYIDSLRCCMLQQSLGGKLVLSAIWSEGEDQLDICQNRILTKRAAAPKQ